MSRWLETAERLFPKLQKRDGNSESELKAAEKRLGFTLPSELRAMYRLAGRRRDLHGAHDRLVPPINLITVNKALVFYEECERTAAWAIRSSDRDNDDPPVVTAQNQPPFAWELDHDALTEFFVTELLWQHVNADPKAVVPETPTAVERIRAQFDEIALPGCHWDVTGCFGREGTVLMIRAGQIFIGATSEDELERARQCCT